MLKKRAFWRRGIKMLLWGAGLLLCIGMAERKLIQQRCENIIVNIDQGADASFLKRHDVEMLVTDGGNSPVLGARLETLNLDEIESRVYRNKLVKSCEVVRDLANNLVVTVVQQVPIARWVEEAPEGEWRQARGFYISDEGKYLPLSNRYSARVTLVSGDFFKAVKGLNNPKGDAYMDVLRYIHNDDFWKAQISQLQVDREGEISFLTTLGNQRIEFGAPETIDSKFKKLRVFYNKVLVSDWNRYSKISVKYKDQVVCE